MKRRYKVTGMFLENVLVLKANGRNHNRLIWGGETFKNVFFSQRFYSFIIRHIGKNLHILKKIENGNKMDIFPIKKYVHKYALSNVKMVIILQNNNK